MLVSPDVDVRLTGAYFGDFSTVVQTILAFARVWFSPEKNTRQDDEKQELLRVGDGPADVVDGHACDEEGFSDGGATRRATIRQVHMASGKGGDHGQNGDQLGASHVLLFLLHGRSRRLRRHRFQHLSRSNSSIDWSRLIFGPARSLDPATNPNHIPNGTTGQDGASVPQLAAISSPW